MCIVKSKVIPIHVMRTKSSDDWRRSSNAGECHIQPISDWRIHYILRCRILSWRKGLDDPMNLRELSWVEKQTATKMYDSKLSFNHYRIRDAVWLLQEARKVGVAQKLEQVYDGPFVVTSMPSPINVTIQLDADGEQKTVHHDQLKLYRDKSFPTWVVKVQNKLTSCVVQIQCLVFCCDKSFMMWNYYYCFTYVLCE